MWDEGPDLIPLTEDDFRPQYDGQLPCRFFLTNWYTCSHEFCRRFQTGGDRYGMEQPEQ